MDSVKSLIEHFSKYEFIANLIPGTILGIFLQFVIGWNFLSEQFFYAFVELYFIGLIANRVGSLIIEPLLKRWKFITHCDYPKYLEAEKNDNKISVLNADSNMYRSFVAVFLISFLAYFYRLLWDRCLFLREYYAIILILALLALFAFAYRKQCKTIVKRAKYNIDKWDSISSHVMHKCGWKVCRYEFRKN